MTKIIKLPRKYVLKEYLVPKADYGLCRLEDVEEMQKEGWGIAERNKLYD